MALHGLRLDLAGSPAAGRNVLEFLAYPNGFSSCPAIRENPEVNMTTVKRTPKANTILPLISPAAASPPAEVGPEDTIAYNRACSPVPASSMPAVPFGYRPTDIDQRRRVLRLVASDLEAEAILALEELTSNATTLKQDLGEFAPDPASAQALFARVQETGRSIAALQALLQFHREIEDIALSDAVVLLQAAYKEYQHRVDRVPQLAQRYAALDRFFRARSAAIAEGMARSKAIKTEIRSSTGAIKTDSRSSTGG
jgi:hypothetical protein